MYKVSVPIMTGNIKRCDRDRLLEELKRFDAERVFLSFDKYETDKDKRETVMKELTDNCKFFSDTVF